MCLGSINRFKVSDEQKVVLIEYWNKGMDNSRTEEANGMVEEVSEKTGMTRKQVQVLFPECASVEY